MRALTYATWVLGAVVIAIGLYVALFVVSSFWLLIITKAVIFSLIFLSITVITGMAGQISLCQASFAAVGCVRHRATRERFGMPVLLTMVIGAVMAAARGRAAGGPGVAARRHLPCPRHACVRVHVREHLRAPRLGERRRPADEGAPPDDVSTGTDAFLFLALGLLVIVAIVVILVRKGTTGRYLDALRGSETAATVDRH